MKKEYFVRDYGLFAEVHFSAYEDEQGKTQWGMRIIRSKSKLKSYTRGLEKNGWNLKDKSND